MGTSSNVVAGKPNVNGCAYIAPITATLPTSTGEELSEDFLELGYVSEDGTKNSNSPSYTTIKEWGGATVLNILESKEDTFTIKFLESLNVNVLKAVYGDDNVSGTLEDGIVIKSNSQEIDDKAVVIDMILTGNIKKRIVLPIVTRTAVSDIEYKGTDAVGYEVTFTCKDDADGNSHYEYIGGK
jgi:hypothetical protein